MSSPAIPANDAAKMNSRDMFGISLALLPEPEVLQAELTNIGCRTLASIIAKLLAENEPLLIADAEGASVRVREIGGSGAFKITVESAK